MISRGARRKISTRMLGTRIRRKKCQATTGVELVGAIAENLTFSRGTRLITGTAATDFNFNKELASVAKKPADSDKVAVNF